MDSDNVRLLLVDDDPTAIRVLGSILAQYTNQCFATSGADALRLAREAPPDLILLDAEMPELNGFDVMALLKAEAAMTDVPVIMVTSHDDAVTELAGFELGAADFIAKPVDAPLLLARVQAQLRVKSMTDELRRIATVDGLTGLSNRRMFDMALEVEWLRGRRCGDPVTLLLIDVDHFKAYNDCYGHPRGDRCLQEVSDALLHASLRPADIVARFGGEEFAILLPQTSRAGGEHIARRVLSAVAALAIPHDASPTARHVTVSVGVACYDVSALDVNPAAARDSADGGARRSSHALLQTADRALYSAKRAGRAQARMLDFADTDTIQLARDITA